MIDSNILTKSITHNDSQRSDKPAEYRVSVMEDEQQVGFLKKLRSVCGSSALDDLLFQLQKENLLDTLRKCCTDYNAQKGSQPGQENISDLLLYLIENIHQHQLDKDQDEEDKHESGNSLNEVVTLMSLHKLLMLCIMKSSLSDSSQEKLVLHRNILKNVATETLILCASYIEQWLWTNEKTRTIAKDILDLLCFGCQTDSISVLLSGSYDTTKKGKEKPLFQQGLLSGILDVLHTRMTSWPPLPHVVCWCAMNIQYPNVGEHFSRLLPSLLKLIDDHQNSVDLFEITVDNELNFDQHISTICKKVANKVLGVQCLHHVMLNMNTAELIWYGRIDVIFEVLHRLLYLNEARLLDELYPCMIHALKVLKSKSGTIDKQMKESDSFMEVILTSMEYESNVQLRTVHMAHLAKVVEHMQINLLRYFKRFVSVVLSYLVVHDDSKEDLRVNVLQVLKTAILHVWPRIAGHTDVILEALLKLVVDCFDSSSECKDQLLDGCMECIIVLSYCCPRPVKKSLFAIKEEVCHAQLQEYVGKVLQNCAS